MIVQANIIMDINLSKCILTNLKYNGGTVWKVDRSFLYQGPLADLILASTLYNNTQVICLDGLVICLLAVHPFEDGTRYCQCGDEGEVGGCVHLQNIKEYM